jgi:hypothetical protein
MSVALFSNVPARQQLSICSDRPNLEALYVAGWMTVRY